jgi:plastocyanin
MPNRRTRTISVALIALLASVLIWTSPGAQASTGTGHRTWSVWVGSQSRNLAIQGMRFLPGSITVNAGDSVDWHANSAEIHTVTFFKGGHPRNRLPTFDPSKARQVTQRGGHVYTPTRYFNSGLMTTVPTGGDAGPLPPVPHYQHYKLTFPHTGRFTYYCLVHGILMTGTITVHHKGAPYPHTQAQYTAKARAQAHALLLRGLHLLRTTRQMAGRHLVMAGNDDGAVMVMRFLRRTVYVHVGKTITWKNPGMGAPHTVTFGREPQPPALFSPSGDPTRFRGGNLNSGILLPGATFKVTFKKAGTYHYVCALHDSLGMRGKVVVEH